MIIKSEGINRLFLLSNFSTAAPGKPVMASFDKHGNQSTEFKAGDSVRMSCISEGATGDVYFMWGKNFKCYIQIESPK